MPMSIRLSALLFASVTAMQDVKPAKRDKQPLAALLESAKQMLKNGETAEVTEFALETLHEITETVIPAIVSESEVSQQALYDRWHEFNVLIDVDLFHWNQEIKDDYQAERDASDRHRACRNTEHEKCYGDDLVCDAGTCPGKRECEKALYEKWNNWVDAEDALKILHESIHGHFCPPEANGTHEVFRVNAVSWMDQYLDAKTLTVTTEALYDAYRPTCIESHGVLDTWSSDCNAKQTELEGLACDHTSAITSTLLHLADRYQDLLQGWNAFLVNVKADEADRRQEYETLKVVECLLERVQELNGRPCDEESGEVDAELAHCHAVGEALVICDFDKRTVPTPGPASGTHSLAHWGPDAWTTRYETFDEVAEVYNFNHHTNGVVDQGVLCLLYPEPPELPSDCPSEDHAATTAPHWPCKPIHKPRPCDGLWIGAEVDPLPGFPVAPFDAENPGCNAYPACTSCPTVQPSYPGWTIDGCPGVGGEQDGELPLTFHNDMTTTADVRCCDGAGSCVSQDFPGGEDWSPEGRDTVYHGCIFGVTHSEALQICDNRGMRLCEVDEVADCCGTGCWHNHHAIWVVPNGASQAD